MVQLRREQSRLLTKGTYQVGCHSGWELRRSARLVSPEGKANQSSETHFCPIWRFPQKILVGVSARETKTEGFAFLLLPGVSNTVANPKPPLSPIGPACPQPLSLQGCSERSWVSAGAGELGRGSREVGRCEPKVLQPGLRGGISVLLIQLAKPQLLSTDHSFCVFS